MDNKFIGLMVGLTVGVLMVSGFLWPVVSDATATTTTFENNGYYTMDKVATDAEFTLTWDSAEPLAVDVGGEKIDLSNKGLVNNMNYTIFGADNFVFRLRTEGSRVTCQYFGSQTVTPTFMFADTTTNSKITAVVAGGNITVSTTNPDYSTPVTFTMTDKTYCINANDAGAYVMKKSNESVYIESTTDIIVLDGLTSLAANDVGIYAEGTINNDLDATIFRGTVTYPVTLRDWTYTTTDVNGYVNLVKLEKVVFTATQNDTDYPVTYSYFIVPAEVTAEKAQHLDTMQIAMIGVIGTLGAIVLIAAAAGSIRRLD